MIKLLKLFVALFLLALIIVLCVISLRPNMSNVGIPYAVPVDDGYEGLKLRWLGVSTLLIDDGETQIMTDGFISRPSLVDLLLKNPISPDIAAIERTLKAQEIDRLAVILPVHSHYDHALDTADVARLTGADILGSSTTANIAASSGLDSRQMKLVEANTNYQYGAFSITLVNSKHAPLSTNSGIEGTVESPFSLPAPYTAWQEGQSYSIHIAHPKGNILVQGSAGFVPGSLDHLRADVVLLGSGGLMDLSSDYVAQYVSETVHSVQAHRAIIIHHDNLFGEFGDVEQSKLVLSFDKSFAFSLAQLVLPARLEQLEFGVDIAIDYSR